MCVHNGLVLPDWRNNHRESIGVCKYLCFTNIITTATIWRISTNAKDSYLPYIQINNRSVYFEHYTSMNWTNKLVAISSLKGVWMSFCAYMCDSMRVNQYKPQSLANWTEHIGLMSDDQCWLVRGISEGYRTHEGECIRPNLFRFFWKKKIIGKHEVWL